YLHSYPTRRSADLHGMNKAQHHEVHGWLAAAAVDEPAVFGVEVRHIADSGPGTKIISTMPRSINRDRSDLGWCIRWFWLCNEPTEDQREDKQSEQQSVSWHTHLL